jgi:hypothetical protein
MQRITRPLTEADRDDRMMLLTSRGEVKRGADAICDSEYRQALHSAQDELGEWGLLHSRNLALGLIDRSVYDLAERERERKLAESVAHMARTGCRGVSCRQGRQPCTEHCAEVAAAGVATACAEPDDTSDGIAARGWRWVREFVRDFYDDLDARLHRI